MIEQVAQSQTPLAQVARAAAYGIAPIYLDPSQKGAVELILVRYARPPVSGSFVYQQIRRKEGGPITMWADCITDVAGEMGDITAFDLAHQVTDLQVVRLVAPRSFDIGDSARRHDDNVRWVKVGPLKRAKGGSEFWLNFDTMPGQVAQIPLKVDNGQFVVDYSTGYVQPASVHSQLQSASYTIQQGQHRMIACVLA